jgi:hypothetical protein
LSEPEESDVVVVPGVEFWVVVLVCGVCPLLSDGVAVCVCCDASVVSVAVGVAVGVAPSAPVSIGVSVIVSFAGAGVTLPAPGIPRTIATPPRKKRTPARNSPS